MSKVVFLVSGGGGTLRFIYYALRQLNAGITIGGIIADRDSAALEFGHRNGIDTRKVSYTRNAPGMLREALAAMAPDLIITNIHKIIDAETLRLFDGKFINLHYSLLPSFGGVIGMETIRQARLLNSRFIGGTCHFVSEEVDAGTIICQSCFETDWERDDYEVCTDTLFRSSCFALLGGIFATLAVQVPTASLLMINNKNVHFSPPVPELPKAGTAFWEEVKDNRQ